MNKKLCDASFLKIYGNRLIFKKTYRMDKPIYEFLNDDGPPDDLCFKVARHAIERIRSHSTNRYLSISYLNKNQLNIIVFKKN